MKSNTSDSRLEWFNVGDYKQCSNMVGDSKTIPPSRVKKEMQRLLFEYQQKDIVTFDDIVEFHYHFEKIHSFQEGKHSIGQMIIKLKCQAKIKIKELDIFFISNFIDKFK